MNRKNSRLVFSRYNSYKNKQRQRRLQWATGAGICVLVITSVVVANKYSREIKFFTSWLPFQEQSPVLQGKKVETPVLQLVELTPTERATQLEAIASEPEQSLDRDRARYLLASDLIAQNQPQEAITWLKELEWDYRVLAPQILYQRAKAYEMLDNKAEAFSAWKTLLQRYYNHPIAAEALYILLSKNSPYKDLAIPTLPENPTLRERLDYSYAFSADHRKYWQTALKKYPSHPSFLALVREKLAENSDQPELLLIIARYAFDDPETISILDTLVAYYSTATGKGNRPLISLEDWEVIGLGYWEDRKYGQASAAYAQANSLPKNAYREALGLEYAEKLREATQTYEKMSQRFPDAPETASALLNLAEIVSDFDAIPYLDRVIANFPDRAGEALLAKARILDRLNSTEAAAEARELLIAKYDDSEAAAEYRTQVAQSKAAQGDIQAAWEWIQPITEKNPHSHQARLAGFWEGKWAKKLGRSADANTAFKQVIADHPQSYYAWRSAVMLGWNVGDFQTIAKLSPTLEIPQQRPSLPAGSPTLKELYQLGQTEVAWTLWQGEFTNKREPTVAEEFTNGLLLIAQNKYLEGIGKIASLEDREDPEEKAEYESLNRQFAYWQALYPFPYKTEITTFAEERDLNPLLVISIMRQESRFEEDITSTAGAIGLMQMLPSTADWAARNLQIKDYSLTNPQDSIRLGTWFLKEIHRPYQNNSLLAIAGYNAGQGNLNRWINDEKEIDFDEFVENIPFNETKNYVKQVFGNYWNYLQLYEPQVNHQVVQGSLEQSTASRK
ncbi:MAG: transglycosylase SLT domain-containing protein [Oscillatoria sp. PMC 1068.18]|nr:transglycosylase SLT domain-containing protein [Oscillatoria sp. PMC 1076.18]MEC4989899.1 transglycosylase SLT domain-containing protein [Oscillatoria sp. PMC 1068.18]